MEKDKVGDGEDDEADDDEKMPSVTMMMKACKSVTAVLGAEVKLQKFSLLLYSIYYSLCCLFLQSSFCQIYPAMGY